MRAVQRAVQTHGDRDDDDCRIHCLLGNRDNLLRHNIRRRNWVHNARNMAASALARSKVRRLFLLQPPPLFLPLSLLLFLQVQWKIFFLLLAAPVAFFLASVETSLSSRKYR